MRRMRRRALYGQPRSGVRVVRSGSAKPARAVRFRYGPPSSRLPWPSGRPTAGKSGAAVDGMPLARDECAPGPRGCADSSRSRRTDVAGEPRSSIARHARRPAGHCRSKAGRTARPAARDGNWWMPPAPGALRLHRQAAVMQRIVAPMMSGSSMRGGHRTAPSLKRGLFGRGGPTNGWSLRSSPVPAGRFPGPSATR